MFADLKFIILWWLLIFGLGTISLPTIFQIFKGFWDKGYIFSKIISLTIITYIIFVLGVFKILPFSLQSILFVIFLWGLANFYCIRQTGGWSVFKKVISDNLKTIFFEEIVFLSILIIWAFVRGYAPDIEGLEKFMDWGFVNSALRSQFFPPADIWFAGQPINYYYFGHLIFALLTKLSQIDSAITYNLSIATVASLTFVSAFAIGSNLIHHFLGSIKETTLRPVIVGGIISALLLTFGGNLHAVYKIAKINIQNEGRLTLTKSAITKAASAYWYPDATRFIGFDPDVKDKTIHEFPLYSFVVADLHGHMNDIPVVLFFVALTFSYHLVTKVKKNASFLDWPIVLISALVLAIAYMTNAWDFAVYGLFWAIAFFFVNLSRHGFVPAFIKTITHGVAIIAFWYLFTLPYSLHFIPIADGLRLSDVHSPFYQLFVLHGGFWLICAPFVIFFLRKLRQAKALYLTDFFVISIIITATTLILLPELGYIKDIYIYEHRRANTMFKLVYQAFILYSLVSGYIFVRLTRSLSRFPSSAFQIVFVLVVISHLIYPYFAIKSYYGLQNYKGLYGLNFLRNRYPDNYQAIEWINHNITGQPVMLEAVGDSYTDYNQVSMATGLPTVEGWIVHEWLWRNGYDQPAARQADVQKIYESTDIGEVRSLLQKYAVKYIFIGDKEREKYPKIIEKNFESIGAKIIAQFGQTKVYQLN